MAKKGRTSETKVTRISASDSKVAKTTKNTKKATPAKTVKNSTIDQEEKRNIVRRFFGYFAGAWYELKQVRWPTRKATWSLTAAVLGFSAFFVLFILLLDAGFKYLFEQLLK